MAKDTLGIKLACCAGLLSLFMGFALVGALHRLANQTAKIVPVQVECECSALAPCCQKCRCQSEKGTP